MLHCQDNSEGRYRNGRVASLDYTQLQERAASDALWQRQEKQSESTQRNTNCNPAGSLLL